MTATISEQLITMTFLLVGIMFVPVLFIALDFWAGIRKAKARRERIKSDKMKRTIQKVARYYNAILAMAVLDATQIAGFVFLHIFNQWTLYTFPFFTLIAVVFVAAIEIKSICEPASEKEQREVKEVLRLVKELVSHGTDAREFANAIDEYLTESVRNDSEGNTTL